MVKSIPKDWYKSRTLWGIVVAVASGIANWAGAINDPMAVLVGTIAGAIAVYGRSVATGPLIQ